MGVVRRPAQLTREIRQKHYPVQGSHRREFHSSGRLRETKRWLDAEKLARPERPAFGLEFEQRRQLKHAVGIGGHLFEKGRERKAQILELAGFGSQALNPAVAEEKLVADRVLPERNVRRGENREQGVQGGGPGQDGPKGMPGRGLTRPAQVEAATIGNEPVDLAQQPGQ